MIPKEYLNGQRLYGDDMSPSEIAQWYEAEKEGYANLASSKKEKEDYGYHLLNMKYAFSHLPKDKRFRHVLGFGSAFGQEFEPLLDRIDSITIIEPSDIYSDHERNGVPIRYIKPNVSGVIDMPDASFDLVVCFGVLHHIPNVSFVMQEIHRVMEPGALFVTREPIVSMGDWTKPRHGLTKNERGLPLQWFSRKIEQVGFEVVAKNVCMFAPLMTVYGKLTGKNPIRSKAFLQVDRIVSSIFQHYQPYHSKNALQKCRCGSCYFVLSKPLVKEH